MWAKSQQSDDAVPYLCSFTTPGCSPNNPPRYWKEPAGSPLGAGSRRRGIRTDKAA